VVAFAIRRRREVESAMSVQHGQDLASESESWVPGEADEYAVRLPVFEGPLDLLLHLIRQNELEISDIPIAEISSQYLEYLSVMRELDLDVAAEYLVMAATLALIKSRMLLPSEAQEEEDLEGDPHALLIARLLEYERYKEVADALAQRRLLGRDVFSAQGPGPLRVPDAERELEVGLFELIEAFRLVLRDAPSGESHEIETETVSVRERMIFVMQRLDSSESLEFNQIFEVEGGALPSRPVIVATFLGILELTRLAAIRIYQGVADSGSPAGPIRLRGTEQEPAAEIDWRARISDLM
jgi:segregation and condensation protein A